MKQLLQFLLTERAPHFQDGEEVGIAHVLSVGPDELSVLLQNGDAYRISIRKVEA